jgi:glucan-binding YG repeat protein
MAEAKEKQEELDLQLEDQDVEVTIDDQPEDAQTDAVAQDDQTEDEFKKAESQTQKRINRLTKKMRDAEKNADEALRFAKQKEQENKELAQKLNQMDTNYVDQYSGRVDSQMAQAEQKLRAAMELGDTEAAVSAQKEMTTLAVEADRAAQAKAANERRKSAPPAPQPVQQPVQQAPQEPDAKAQAWAQKNEWFGNDSAMTYAAFGIHKDLVEQEGIDPKSDEYYTELNERMGKEFPHKFNNGAQSRKVVQNVASASRPTGS